MSRANKYNAYVANLPKKSTECFYNNHSSAVPVIDRNGLITSWFTAISPDTMAKERISAYTIVVP